MTLSFGNFVDERIVVAAISSDQSCHKKGDLLRFYIPNTLDTDLSLSSNKYKISWVEMTSCYIWPTIYFKYFETLKYLLNNDRMESTFIKTLWMHDKQSCVCNISIEYIEYDVKCDSCMLLLFIHFVLHVICHILWKSIKIMSL